MHATARAVCVGVCVKVGVGVRGGRDGCEVEKGNERVCVGMGECVGDVCAGGGGHGRDVRGGMKFEKKT